MMAINQWVTPITQLQELSLANQTLNDFLMSIERRAFLMARFSAGNDADALDIVQEAMMRLAHKYGDKSEVDWRPLFYRILHSRIQDYHRRSAVRNRFSAWLGVLIPGRGEDVDGADPFDYIAGLEQEAPDLKLASERRMQVLEETLKTLPLRQRQAFMLRCWEGHQCSATPVILDFKCLAKLSMMAITDLPVIIAFCRD
ncbi:MAG: RNA polymerase sigma-70 factor (ECF subfamily), partial [Pseudohongiellaceae bacterium]